MRAELGASVPKGRRSFELEIVDRATGKDLCRSSVEPTQSVYPASTIKTLIAVAALRLVDRGRLTLGSRIRIDQPEAFAADECREREGDPSCAVFGPGKTVTLDMLLADMIAISNNLAADQLIDVVGKDFIGRTARELGVPSLRVVRKVYNNVDPEPDSRVHNAADAAGLAELFRRVVSTRDDALSQSSRAYLIGLLRRQYYHDYFDKDFPPGAVYFHKDGYTSHVVADSGFYLLGSNRAAILVGLADYTRRDPRLEPSAWKSDEDSVISAFVRIGRGTYALTQDGARR